MIGTKVIGRIIQAILLIIVMFLALIIVQWAFFFYDDGARERTIIANLLGKGYRFVLPRDYFAGVRYNKTALLIHDADFSVDGLPVFVKIEQEYGIKSAFYPRPDTEWFSQNIKQFQEIEQEGWEIGFQYDCLSRADSNATLAMQIFRGQLSYMRTFFDITTTTYHGDSYNFSIINYDLYNQTVWESLRLHEVYSIKDFSYYSDTNNHLTTPNSLGDLVVVQLHTDWTK